jgi:hypothetical protein
MAQKKAAPKRASRKPTVEVAIVKPERRYEVEDAMRTLHRAEQIRKDPKLMGDVRTHTKELAKSVGREPRK